MSACACIGCPHAVNCRCVCRECGADAVTGNPSTSRVAVWNGTGTEQATNPESSSVSPDALARAVERVQRWVKNNEACGCEICLRDAAYLRVLLACAASHVPDWRKEAALVAQDAAGALSVSLLERVNYRAEYELDGPEEFDDEIKRLATNVFNRCNAARTLLRLPSQTEQGS